MPEIKQVNEFAQGRVTYESNQLHLHIDKLL